jgi:nucleoid DNA-binding protein
VTPRLNLKKLVGIVAQRNNKLPPNIVRLSIETIFQTISSSLATGQAVSLRKFGRLIPRRYTKTPKKQCGLVFHPSRQLTDLVNLKAKNIDS